MSLVKITSAGITDGTVVNDDINASAAIAGTKISPNFGSQHIQTSGDLRIIGTFPNIKLQDSDNDSDFRISNANGKLLIYDTTNAATRFTVNADGHIDVAGNLDVGAGLDVTGDITATGTTTSGYLTLNAVNPNITFTDSNDNPDFRLEVNSGQLKIVDSTNSADRLIVQSDGTIDVQGNLDANGGLDVTGEITATSHLDMPDNAIIKLGTADDLQIFHENTNDTSRLATTTGTNIEIRNIYNSQDEAISKFIPNGAVEIYYDGSKKLETTSSGATVTGNLFATNKFRGNDDVKLELGTGNDLQIYHNGSHSIINNSTGDLRIESDRIELLNNASNEFYLTGTANGTVELYYDNASRLGTTAYGVNIIGDARWGDGRKATFGNDGTDLQIYHDGSHSRIVDNGTGVLSLQGSDVNIHNPDASENMILAAANGGVRLYYDNSKKFETTSNGASFLDNVRWNDNKAARFGGGDDLQIYHDGTNSYLKNNTGVLYLQGDNIRFLNDAGNENIIKAFGNGAVELHYDGVKKFETKSDGIDVTGEVQCDSLDVDGGFNIDGSQITYDASVNIMKFTDNAELRFGSGNDFRFYHDSSDTANIILASSGSLNIRMNSSENAIVARQNGAVELYYDNVKTFQTDGNGIFAYGPEGGTANVYIYADEGDDNADKWSLTSGTDGTFTINNRASGGFEKNIECNGNGNVELYYDSSKKFNTNSEGVSVHGNLALNAADNYKIYFGAGNDLQIYHDASHSYVLDNGTGELRLASNGGGVRITKGDSETLAFFDTDGVNELYYDNSKKLETKSDGIDVTGEVQCDSLDVDGAAHFNGNDVDIVGANYNVVWDYSESRLKFNDNAKLSLGSAADAFFYHNGSHTYIDNQTGALYLRNNTGTYNGNPIVLEALSGENAIVANPNGQVKLYYDNALRFTTESSGVKLYNLSQNSGNGMTLHYNSSTGEVSFNNTQSGGKTLQVVSSTLSSTNSVSISGNTFQDIGLSASITPSSSSNKILVFYSVHTNGPSGYRSAQRLLRGSTVICQGNSDGDRARVATAQGNIQSDNSHMTNLTMNFLDSPSTTSSVTYKVQGHVESNGTMYINRAADTGSGFSKYRPVSTITLMEIAA